MGQGGADEHAKDGTATRTLDVSVTVIAAIWGTHRRAVWRRDGVRVAIPRTGRRGGGAWSYPGQRREGPGARERVDPCVAEAEEHKLARLRGGQRGLARDRRLEAVRQLRVRPRLWNANTHKGTKVQLNSGYTPRTSLISSSTTSQLYVGCFTLSQHARATSRPHQRGFSAWISTGFAASIG